MAQTTRGNVLIAIGLTICFILTVPFSLFLGSVRANIVLPTNIFVGALLEWGPAVLLVIFIKVFEKKPLSSIGIRRMNRGDVIWSLVGFLVGLATFFVSTPLVTLLNLGTTRTGIAELAQIPIPFRVAIPLSAGVVEEILSRGYPIERLTVWTKSVGLSAMISFLLFVVFHIPFWGLGGAIQIGGWTVVVTILYIRRRNLPSCMLMHILNNAFAFIILPLLFVT